MWLTLPFYDFCGFRSVAVNSVFINCSFFTLRLSVRVYSHYSLLISIDLKPLKIMHTTKTVLNSIQ